MASGAGNYLVSRGEGVLTRPARLLAAVGRAARRYGVPLRPPVPPQRHDCPQLRRRLQRHDCPQ
ncbi:hypothetical protein [Streptomyces flavalbus]|uniref:Uncharacterized protein n=1 Tax=Streptomyces flavalbus TaxID=2665155 RepID=A0ABW2WFQ1_9ACTN